MALTLLGLTVLVFLMLRLIPGTVVEQMIGADAIVSPEMVAQLRRFFGLDQPWWVQYSRWLGNLAQGDLGTSWRTGKPVVRLILERLPVTIELTLLAVGFALALGIAAGIVSAVRRDRAVDNVVRVGALPGRRHGPCGPRRRHDACPQERPHPHRDRRRPPDGHPPRRHRRRRGGLHPPRRRPPRPLVHLPARLPAHAVHHPLRRRPLHGDQPGGGHGVRVSRSADPLRGVSRGRRYRITAARPLAWAARRRRGRLHAATAACCRARRGSPSAGDARPLLGTG